MQYLIFKLPNLGDFKEGLKHGQGQWTGPSGETYVGGYEDDMKQGSGKLAFPNGERYEGAFTGNKFHGEGTWHGANGQDTYSGGWFRNKKDGAGILTSTVTGTYDGQWSKNQKHGEGKWSSNDGETYVGQWELDMKHGGACLPVNELLRAACVLVFDRNFVLAMLADREVCRGRAWRVQHQSRRKLRRHVAQRQTLRQRSVAEHER